MKTSLIETTPRGIEVYELTNDKGMRAQILNYGARIHKLFVPTKTGEFVDVVAGFDDPEGFMGDNPYFNAIIGRTVNRTQDSRFVLDGKTYTLYPNFGRHSQHGGKVGFDGRFWQVQEAADARLVLAYHSPDGEEGYPADVDVEVTYYLDNDNALHIDYRATSSAPTPLGMTNHAYFHLGGAFDSIHDHVLWINSGNVTTLDEDLVSHGGRMAVEGTPFDFRHPKALGQDIGVDHELLRNGRGGYDINYVLDPGDVAAILYCPASGVRMTVSCDFPCLQLYTGNFLDGTLVGKHRYAKQSTVCLETQDYPNAINVPSFPSPLLDPSRPYVRHSAYRFDIQ